MSNKIRHKNVPVDTISSIVPFVCAERLTIFLGVYANVGTGGIYATFPVFRCAVSAPQYHFIYGSTAKLSANAQFHHDVNMDKWILLAQRHTDSCYSPWSGTLAFQSSDMSRKQLPTTRASFLFDVLLHFYTLTNSASQSVLMLVETEIRWSNLSTKCWFTQRQLCLFSYVHVFDRKWWFINNNDVSQNSY